jgi:hypothetical protein
MMLFDLLASERIRDALVRVRARATLGIGVRL